MRILHVNDNAGVAGLMATYQRRLGHTVEVVARDGYDGFKQKEYYGVRIIGPTRRRFKDFGILQKPLRLLNRTLSCAVFYGWIAVNRYRFDVIHIHSQYLVSFVLPFKKKIVEFHGDDIRGSPSKRWLIDRIITSLYLHVFRGRVFLVSTPDMVNDLPHATWLPNPVDTGLFFKNGFDGSGRAVYFHNWYESGVHAARYAAYLGLELAVVDRVKLCHLFYKDMPRYLSGFEVMIDRKEIHSLSKTALEALACGLKVVDWQGQTLEGLPTCHDPEFVAKKSVEIYEGLMKND